MLKWLKLIANWKKKKKKEDHVNLLWRKVDKWHYFQWQLSMS